MPLSEHTQQELRQRRDEFKDTESAARREFHETVAAARRRYLDSIVAALDEGTQVEVAEALGITRGRVWQLVREANDADATPDEGR